MDNTIVSIGKNDPCPCGSEKRFMDCCESKEHKYGLVEYGDKSVIFDLDEVDNHVTALLNYCFSNIIVLHNRGGVKLDKGVALGHLRTIYKLLDKIFSPFLRYSSCKKGCSECCHQLTWATAIEAEMIRGHTEKSFDRKNRLDVLSRIHKATIYDPGPIVFGERYPDDVLFKFHESRTLCPFLSGEDSCMVYESRPFECRKFIAFSHPRECKIMGKIDSYDGAYFPYIYTALECLSALVYQDLTYRKYLPGWFVNELRFGNT